jgi:hypothetical protein
VDKLTRGAWREQFLTAVETLKTKHALVQDFTVRAEAAIKELTGSCRTIRQQAESDCQMLHMRVTELQHKLVQVVDARERQRRAVLKGMLEGQRQKLSVWGAMLQRANQILADDDGAVFLDVNTNVLDKQLRGAADASLNPPTLQSVSPGLTLNLGHVLTSLSNMHFVELLVPASPSALTCVEHHSGADSSLLITWKCDTVNEDPNTFVVEQRRLHQSWPLEHEKHPWVEIYKGPNRTCSAVGLQDHESYCFRISATNSSGTSAWSPPAIFTAGRPTAPASLILLQRSSRALTIAWAGEPVLSSPVPAFALPL